MTDYPLLCLNPGCRPIDHGGPRRTERAWFCPVCIDKAGDHLRFIADSWDDLEAALVRGDSASGEPVKGSREVGLVLNEKAAAARAKATSDVWAFARIVLEWADEKGRVLSTPGDSSVATLARWLADWHLAVFTVHAGQLTALAFMEDVWANRRAVKRAAYPSGARKVETGLRCVEHGTSTDGEQVPCEGTMHAWVVPQATMLPDLVCSEDQAHRLDPATWQRQGWKRAHSRPMDPDAMTRLADSMLS